MVYYNDIDEFANSWLWNLTQEGVISEGIVDDRSILDVLPSDLSGFDRCHFFSGIGVWDYALRQAGWPDDVEIWTGSCPCQPFSSAGKRKGVADERHLWPYWFHLIRSCRPRFLIGEQVASKDGLAWLDLVQADLEGEGYTTAAVDICAAGFGAPHIRQRLYWVAFSNGSGCRGSKTGEIEARSTEGRDTKIPGTNKCREFQAGLEGSGSECTSGVVLSDESGSQPGRITTTTTGQGNTPESASGISRLGESERNGWNPRGAESSRPECVTAADDAGRMADHLRNQEHQEQHRPTFLEGKWGADELGRCGMADSGSPASPLNGFWHPADWLFCRDGKWRPVEPGTFPLAYGTPNRVGLLRGYGNAIVAPQAIEFVVAAMDILGIPRRSRYVDGDEA